MSQADLNQLLVFAKVVEHGSFIAASRALGLPKTTVSRKVQELEERLGARLLQRTTRRVALTEAGAIYHEYCSRIVQDIADADLAVGRVHSAPRGELRVSASFSFGMGALVPIVPDFMARYPDIRLQLELRNDAVDLVAEGFDLAIRIGPLEDSSCAVRYLAESRLALYASPDYLARAGWGRPRRFQWAGLPSRAAPAAAGRIRLPGGSGSPAAAPRPGRPARQI